jgi:hypothetical protein
VGQAEGGETGSSPETWRLTPKLCQDGLHLKQIAATTMELSRTALRLGTNMVGSMRHHSHFTTSHQCLHPMSVMPLYRAGLLGKKHVVLLYQPTVTALAEPNFNVRATLYKF